MTEHAALLLISFIANTMSAFAGGGSGLVQFPALLFLGLPFATALATHKIATVALGLGSTYRHVKHKAPIDWHFALIVMLCGVLGTIVGAGIIVNIPDRIAGLSLGLLTIALGVYSIFKKSLGQASAPKNRDLKGFVLGGFVLFLIGVFNGSLSSGSGLFVTVWLILWFGVDYKSAVMYTMTLVGIFWNLTGAMAVSLLGHPVYWAWVPTLLLGSFAGGYAGAHMGALKGNLWIKRGFEAVTILSGAYLLYKSIIP